MSAVDTDRFRRLLLDERERVTGALTEIEQEQEGEGGEEGSAETHLGDAASETFELELDVTLTDNSRSVLGQIDSALERIDEGNYGTCRICGKPIPEERLEALPYADLCIDDQRKLEHG
ncbi:MAG: TraR/DksA C4-type zinc finger protein [Actinobacteria bacterium]|nr:TraR/DksA C4-type zinc finger protein [Actinomycetota bacterium]